MVVTKGLVRGLGNNGMGEDYPNYSIIEIGLNTEKCPGDLKRLDVTQTPVRNHCLTLVWKTRKGITIIIMLTLSSACVQHIEN